MNRAERYRERAGDCVEVAQAVADPRLKTTLLQMAQQWIGLARISERAYAPGKAARKDTESEKS
jgi:hypothetical protein